jgi:hypothetical protein
VVRISSATDDHAPGGQGGLARDAQRAPCVRMPLRVRALHVEDGHVGREGGDQHHRRARPGIGRGAESRVGFEQPGAEQAAGGDVGRARRAGEQRHGQAEVRVILHRERRRHALLASASIVVTQSLAHVPDPCGDDPAHAACADELIEQDVGDRAHQGEASSGLADELVARGIGNGRFQGRAHAHGSAVRDEAGNRFPQRGELGRGHSVILTRFGDRLAGPCSDFSSLAHRPLISDC